MNMSPSFDDEPDTDRMSIGASTKLPGTAITRLPAMTPFAAPPSAASMVLGGTFGNEGLDVCVPDFIQHRRRTQSVERI
jgi:hypothetical protein